eukprot:CAMPEP_0175165570 /NCGR_PEP_ID=MMETSP0087-20121206/27164_1 /TAXON_ID=136419 /ORGANISM="Unknown Unknown, Strain D1" /LENGTH=319 /DNA_ID=CAMNT_0016454971 /DNA_START=1 /DNA_END=958 /DNA_ORIENTATION=-
MPWVLSKRDGPDVLLSAVKECQVGRSRECQISPGPPTDQSISRVHATVYVSKLRTYAQTDSRSDVTLVDCSKFGTLVNGIRCKAQEHVVLKEGDSVQFGVLETSVLRLVWVPLVMCYSRLSRAVKGPLIAKAQNIGAHLVNSWSLQCTTSVDTLFATEKVLLAFIQEKPIVHPNWLLQIDNAEFPPTADFPPQPSHTLPTLNNEPEFPGPRTALFAGKTFVFFVPQQLQRNRNIIEASGGKVVLLQSFQENETFLDDFKDFVMMQPLQPGEDGNLAVVGGGALDQSPELAILLSSIESVDPDKYARMTEESNVGTAILQ